MKTTALNGHFQKDCCFVDARNYFGILYKMGGYYYEKEEGALKNVSVGGFYLGSVGLLRYTQITTRHVVIKAPAIPDRTHSAVNIDGKTAKSQGHTVW
jgi:hypothetical protein